MKHLTYIFLAGLMLIVLACGVSTEDINATVQARIASIPTPTPDIDATVEARIKKALAQAADPVTLTPIPAQIPTATPTPIATQSQLETATPLPTRTPWPTPTPLPTRTPWPTPTPDLELAKKAESERLANSGLEAYNDAIYFRNEGDIESAIKKVSSAIEKLESALVLYPEVESWSFDKPKISLIAAYGVRASLYIDLSEWDESIKDHTTQIDLLNDIIPIEDINELTSYDNLTEESYYELAQHDSVFGINGIASTLPIAYYDRGTSYINIEKYSNAVKDFTIAINTIATDHFISDSKYAEFNCSFYYNRGYAYDELEQYELAIEDYDAAITNCPDLNSAEINKGISQKALDELSKPGGRVEAIFESGELIGSRVPSINYSLKNNSKETLKIISYTMYDSYLQLSPISSADESWFIEGYGDSLVLPGNEDKVVVVTFPIMPTFDDLINYVWVFEFSDLYGTKTICTFYWNGAKSCESVALPTSVLEISTPIPQPSTTPISWDLLYFEYESNGIAADLKYGNEVISVSGVVDSVDYRSTWPGDIPYEKLPYIRIHTPGIWGAWGSLYCVLGSVEEAINVNKYDLVTVWGTVSAWVYESDLYLYPCHIVD